MRVIIFTDGGSRGNPGDAASAFVVEDEKGGLIHKNGSFLGVKTNNDAEYEAFLLSVKWLADFAKTNDVDRVEWRLDSMLVVEQLNKKWKIKEERMRVLAQQIWQELQDFSFPFTISHIPREKNKLADALVNEVLDLQAQS